MIHVGDCRDILPTMAAESVQCCVTSPPYFGLRDYGVDGQMGLEPTPDEFIAGMVSVFREVRRVLKPDGTLWLNIGDSYASTGGHADKHCNDRRGARNIACRPEHTHRDYRVRGSNGIKPKDLIGIPWMLAFALRADGWYLRQDIIWHKPNPMPESVTDRCTKSHEYLFLFAKSGKPTVWRAIDSGEWSHRPNHAERVPWPIEEDPHATAKRWRGHDYYFDAEAIAEPLATASIARLAQDVESQRGSDRVPGKTNGTMKAVGGKGNRRTFRGGGVYTAGRSFDNDAAPCNDSVGNVPNERGVRNKRSVWTVATQPFREAHFATFPPALIEPCILAGTRPGDVVLDPFLGAGTTAVVAERLGRQWIGCELNPDYAEIARRRIAAVQPGLALGTAA